MKDFDQFICDNKDRKISVTKLKNLDNPANHTSEIPLGNPYVGQVTLRFHEETDWGPGFQILVNGGFTFSSSLVREVVQKSPTKWLAKTLNSVYRVEIVG